MKLSLCAVGRIRERPLRECIDDYLERLRRYCRCDEIEIQDGADLLRRIPRGAFVVALDPAGEALTSQAFARRLERWLSRKAP